VVRQLTTSASVLIGQAPTFEPLAPPGGFGTGVPTILSWVAWFVTAGAVLGFLIAAGKLVLAHRRGEEVQVFSGIGMIALGCLLFTAAGPLTNLLLGMGSGGE
jgi:hypothetical protein